MRQESCGYMCYAAAMGNTVSVRELRNKVSEVLRRVESGERITVTVDRRPIAELRPLRRRGPVPAADAWEISRRWSADRGLLADLQQVVPDTTDEL